MWRTRRQERGRSCRDRQNSATYKLQPMSARDAHCADPFSLTVNLIVQRSTKWIIAASILGLAAVLHASAVAFEVVRYLGVLYLFYMAWNVLQDAGVLEVSGREGSVPVSRIALNGFLLNILNPKLSLFFLAFLPQFVPVGTLNATVQMLLLAAVLMLLTFIIFIGYGAFASATRRHVISRPKVMLCG